MLAETISRDSRLPFQPLNRALSIAKSISKDLTGVQVLAHFLDHLPNENDLWKAVEKEFHVSIVVERS